MRCDTCGKETDNLRRVVIAKGYDRTKAVAIFNCEECFREKEAHRKKETKRG